MSRPRVHYPPDKNEEIERFIRENLPNFPDNSLIKRVFVIARIALSKGKSDHEPARG